ncbi:MAG TPA: PH domain-containing protein [Silvibacterium sp.]|nr:PH domain-containing protein [Silvibacterium sp.]
MGYLQHVLQPGETVLQEGRLHWFIYWRAFLFLIIACGIAALYFVSADPTVQQAALIGGAVALALSILFFIGAAIRRSSTELAVTDHRIIYKTGVFSRHTMEMNRSKVESVDVDQSFFGRMFGYGTILVRGTGGSLEPLPNIQDPLTLRSHITVA